MADDPWNGIESRFPAGTGAKGMVASKSKFGYFIDLADGVTGLLPFGNIAADRKESIRPGETVDVTVQSVDAERRRISLSLGLAEIQKDAAEAREYMARQKKPEPQVSSEFGEMLKTALGKGKTGS